MNCKLRRVKWRALLAATATVSAMIGICAPAASARTNYALLVAVTDYPNFPQKNWLVGPNHDAVLVRDYLEHGAPAPFAADHVTLLADNVEGAAGAPTHQHILAELAALAAKAVPGDFVYIHLSGHGAQEPERVAGSELDGYDEIFLPSDTAKWSGDDKRLPNALVDDEIGGALDAIRDKGAFVWAVFDACHSGSATRAAPVGPDLEVSRKMDADELGIPASALPKPKATTPDEERQPAFKLGADAPADGSAGRAINLTGEEQPQGAKSIAKGGMVAFFAAQTVETTPEMPLPKGAEDAERYGLFTYTIMSKLAENPNVTYRQLARAVLQQYSADARERPTPLFEGVLDAKVFGTDKTDAISEWPVTVKDGSATLPAGMLQRVTKGTKLAILPKPTSDMSEAVGYVEVQSAKNLSSKVLPVSFGGKDVLKLDAFPPNAYARLAEVAIDFRLKVARPAPASGTQDAVALANATLDAVAAAKDKRFNIALVEPGADADLRLAVLSEAAIKEPPADGVAATAAKQVADPVLVFLPPSGELSLNNGRKPPFVAIDAKAPDRLAKGTEDNLTKIFRATSLSRLAAASDYSNDEVKVAFTVKRQNSDAMEPLDGAAVPIVSPGDEVHIQAENLSTKIVDINVLYVGSDYSISHMAAERLVSGAKLDEGLLAFTDSSFGMERMIAVLTEAPPQSEIEDLSFLEQGGVPPETRDAAGAGNFSGLLADIGLAPSTRSAMKIGDKDGQKGAVMIFPLETVPRP